MKGPSKTETTTDLVPLPYKNLFGSLAWGLMWAAVMELHTPHLKMKICARSHTFNGYWAQKNDRVKPGEAEKSFA